MIHVDGATLLEHAEPLDFSSALNLEHLPNRDCLPYAEEYGIADAHTVYRKLETHRHRRYHHYHYHHHHPIFSSLKRVC